MIKYRTHCIIVFISFISQFVNAQGKVLENKKVKSTYLGREVSYSIYLPADYDISTRKYPVVYLLHGYSDNETAWVQFGNVNQSADKLIASGEITPMIIVMPDGGLSWYINDFQNKERYFDFFSKELLTHIDANYRTRSERDYRAIAGLSMGGYGALIHSLKSPHLFSACAALSAAIRTEEELLQKPFDYKTPWFPLGTEGSLRLTAHWRNFNVLDVVKQTPLDSLNKVRWYIDCGDEDFLTVGNATLHIILRERGVSHEYRVRDGAHNWAYWRYTIQEALKFITKGFDRR